MGITGMIYMVTIVFSLIVLILSSSAARYDYFQFTQQYQLAVCNSNSIPCKDPPDKLFTVHGLWPSDSNGHDPVNCSKTTVDAQKLGNLTTQLEIIWPNVYKRNDHISFWNKQWTKHGSCGHPTIMNDIHYFQTAIKMYITQNQNVSKILSKAKIEPEGKPRKQIDIVNAIRKGIDDKEPKLKCQKHNQVTELVEVTLCSNRNLTRFINCPRHIPNASRFSCPTENIMY